MSYKMNNLSGSNTGITNFAGSNEGEGVNNFAHLDTAFAQSKTMVDFEQRLMGANNNNNILSDSAPLINDKLNKLLNNNEELILSDEININTIQKSETKKQPKHNPPMLNLQMPQQQMPQQQMHNYDNLIWIALIILIIFGFYWIISDKNDNIQILSLKSPANF